MYKKSIGKNPKRISWKFSKGISGGTQIKNLKEYQKESQKKYQKTPEDATEGTADGSPRKILKWTNWTVSEETFWINYCRIMQKYLACRDELPKETTKGFPDESLRVIIGEPPWGIPEETIWWWIGKEFELLQESYKKLFYDQWYE